VTFEHIIGYGRMIYERALNDASIVEKWHAIQDYDDEDAAIKKSFFRCLPKTADKEQLDAILATFELAGPNGLIIERVADLFGQTIGQVYRTICLLY
jgi:hypothetical protein